MAVVSAPTKIYPSLEETPEFQGNDTLPLAIVSLLTSQADILD